MKHLYNGNCPDDVDQKTRDKECPLCKLITKEEMKSKKQQLKIKHAFEKINPNIIGIEILEDSLRINYNYPSREKAIIAARPVGEYFSKEVGRPVCVQVFYWNKNGSISDFQNAYAAKAQYYNRGARVKG